MAELRTAHKVNADSLDRAKMGIAKPGRAGVGPEVEGQQHSVGVFSTACPHCGSVLSEGTNSLQFEWFTCSICGGAFQA